MEKNKKGFTLVELLVVIAILAILAAVSVVGYLSFTNKAKESNDNTLVNELNKVLLAEETLSGKPKTMHEAIQILDDNGFVIEKLTPTSDKNEFIYDLVNNKFIIIKNDELLTSDKANYNLWIIVDDEDTLTKLTTKYSIYLSNKYRDDDNMVVVNNGLDVGNYKELNSIEYNNSDSKKEVLFNTKGGSLIINGKYGTDKSGDVVSHYGNATIIDVNSVGMNSYHEFGTVSTVKLKKGKVAIEKTSNVGAIIINTNIANDISVNIKVNENIPNVVIPSGTIADNFKDVITSKNQNKLEVIVNKEVSTFEELLTAITRDKYITLKNDINYQTNGQDLLNVTTSTTIDGNGFAINGYGNRNNNATTIAINNGGSNLVDVIIKNITINNSGDLGRAVETRGNINSLKIDNSTLNVTGNGNNQTITIGGNQASTAKISINDTTITANNAGYALLTFNPIALSINHSNLSGYACLYLKGKNGSEGSHGSKIYINDSNLDSPNVHSPEGFNDFGCIVLDDGDIEITLENTKVNATAKLGAKQSTFVLTIKPNGANSTSNVNINVLGSNTYINGSIYEAGHEWTNSKLIIHEGKFTEDPTEYISPNSIVINDGLYIVNKK